MRQKRDIKITVIGSAWYGDWAKNFYLACRRAHIPSDIVYTNAFPAATGGNRDDFVSLFERAKFAVRKYFPFLFVPLKKARRFFSDIELCAKVLFGPPARKHICVYVWIPGSAWVLRLLKKRKIILVLWQGEATVRDPSWEPLFDYFDSVFMVSDGNWIDALREERNRKRVKLLPLASDNTIFFPTECSKTSEVVFAGKYLRSRAEVLRVLTGFNLKIYGYGWEEGFAEFPWLKDFYCGAVPTSDMNRIFNESEIAIGTLWLLREPYTGPSTRIFDVALAGVFQLVEDMPLSRELFGDTVAYFNNAEELRDKVAYFLAHRGEREEMARRARAIGLQYTYSEAVKKILSACNEQYEF